MTAIFCQTTLRIEVNSVQNRKRTPSFFVVVSLIALIAIAFFVLYNVFSAETVHRDGIVLPDKASQAPTVAYSEDHSENLVSVTKDNVASVVENLSRPLRYHQSLLVARSFGADAVSETVDVYACGSVFYVRRQEKNTVSNYLTDGGTVYTWYDDDRQDISKRVLPFGIGLDEIASVPTYEVLYEIPKDELTAAEYRQSFGDMPAPCIFAERKVNDSTLERYWVDCSTGLLCKAEQVFEGNICLSAVQNAFELYAPAEQAFAEHFRLPDGSLPFEISEETQTRSP